MWGCLLLWLFPKYFPFLFQHLLLSVYNAETFKGLHRNRAFALFYIVLQESRFQLNIGKHSLIECLVSSPYSRGYLDRFHQEFLGTVGLDGFQYIKSSKNLVGISQKYFMTDKAKWMNNCSDELTVNYPLTLILLKNVIGQLLVSCLMFWTLFEEDYSKEPG